MNNSPIESIGHVNVKTGSSKYFNVVEEWPDSTCEIWLDHRGLYKFVFTAGSTPIGKPDEEKTFIANQSRRKLFTGKFVTSCPVPELKETALKVIDATSLKWYKNKVMGYTYK